MSGGERSGWSIGHYEMREVLEMMLEVGERQHRRGLCWRTGRMRLYLRKMLEDGMVNRWWRLESVGEERVRGRLRKRGSVGEGIAGGWRECWRSRG